MMLIFCLYHIHPFMGGWHFSVTARKKSNHILWIISSLLCLVLRVAQYRQLGKNTWTNTRRWDGGRVWLVIFREGLFFGGPHHTQIPNTPPAKPTSLKWRKKRKKHLWICFDVSESKEPTANKENYVWSTCGELLHPTHQIYSSRMIWSQKKLWIKKVVTVPSHLDIRHVSPWLQLCLSLTIVTLKVSGGSGASFPLLWENLNLFTKPFVFIFLHCFWRFSHFFHSGFKVMIVLYSPGTWHSLQVAGQEKYDWPGLRPGLHQNGHLHIHRFSNKVYFLECFLLPIASSISLL